jgi:hypothetical protein
MGFSAKLDLGAFGRISDRVSNHVLQGSSQELRIAIKGRDNLLVRHDPTAARIGLERTTLHDILHDIMKAQRLGLETRRIPLGAGDFKKGPDQSTQPIHFLLQTARGQVPIG